MNTERQNALIEAMRRAPPPPSHESTQEALKALPATVARLTAEDAPTGPSDKPRGLFGPGAQAGAVAGWVAPSPDVPAAADDEPFDQFMTRVLASTRPPKP